MIFLVYLVQYKGLIDGSNIFSALLKKINKLLCDGTVLMEIIVNLEREMATILRNQNNMM